MLPQWCTGGPWRAGRHSDLKLSNLVGVSRLSAARCYLADPTELLPVQQPVPKNPHRAKSHVLAVHVPLAFEGMHCKHPNVRLAAAGQQIQVRPRLDSSGQVHAWSQVSTQGDAGVSLAALEEGQSSLLSCSASATSVQQGASPGSRAPVRHGAAAALLAPYCSATSTLCTRASRCRDQPPMSRSTKVPGLRCLQQEPGQASSDPHNAATGGAVAEDVAQKPANLAGASVCLSLTVEGTPLSDAGSGGMTAQEPLTDWRLVLGPALLVENLLPVRGTFLVWEQPQVGGLRRAAALQDEGSEGKVYCMRGMQHRAGLFSGSGCCSVGWPSPESATASTILVQHIKA